MPKLRSGRHFALEQRTSLESAMASSSEEVYALVLLYRLEVKKPEDLALFLPVVYFEEGKGEPPNAPKYRSGFLVMDVLDGKAGWTADESEELMSWIKDNEPLKAVLNKKFAEIDLAIRNSPLWDSDFMQS